MFTITICKLGFIAQKIEFTTTVETLGEAEIVARAKVEKVFSIVDSELVYIEDLDYYVYIGESRVGRLTIKPIYCKARI